MNAPQPQRQAKRLWTREEVAKHNTKDDCFTIIHQKVYDVTHYMDKHPGGYDLMFRNAGKDSTADFEAMYHSQRARALLDDYYVGDVDNRGSVTSDSSNMLTRFAQQNRLSVYSSANSGATVGSGGGGGSSNMQYPFLKTNNDNRLQKLREMQASWSRQKPVVTTGTATITNPTMTITTNSASGAIVNNSSGGSGQDAASQQPMSTISFKKYKLVNRLMLNRDTGIFKFKLHSRSHILSIPPGKHLQVCIVKESSENVASPPIRIMRKYTPVRSDQPGYFELLIKRYDTGNVSQHIFDMEIGDRLLMRGPFGIYQYTPEPKHPIVMIAMGTGITPMYQIIQHVVNDEHDTTQLTLLYGSRTEEDILLYRELQLLTERYPNKLTVHYFISKPSNSDNIRGSTDADTASSSRTHKSQRINLESLREIEPEIKIREASQVLLCGTDDFCHSIKTICKEEYGQTDDKIHVF